MAFFAGWPDGTPGHDELAEKIGMNAMKFVKDHWRWEDMQAYVSISTWVNHIGTQYLYQMFRLLLEYARLASSDREAASFTG